MSYHEKRSDLLVIQRRVQPLGGRLVDREILKADNFAAISSWRPCPPLATLPESHILTSVDVFRYILSQLRDYTAAGSLKPNQHANTARECHRTLCTGIPSK